MGFSRVDPITRFWSKAIKTNGCLVWQSAKDHGGYGIFRMDGKNFGAHRVAYVIAKGEIKKDLQIDHLCKTRDCVNPEHLEAVTARTNYQRSSISTENKTHCKRGHAFSTANTATTTVNGKFRQRVCKQCRNAYARWDRACKSSGKQLNKEDFF